MNKLPVDTAMGALQARLMIFGTTLRLFLALGFYASVATLALAEVPAPIFNRAPLAEKPFSELPLGAIKADGWLQDELLRMAKGMSGHLDEWYPEVCGDRNGWLGGDGDTWERGPYWIDGLYPLAIILGDKALEAKAMRWINWTLDNQREDGQIGPRGLKASERTQPPPEGAQVGRPSDWWPRMVMLKILQQHYLATGDKRVIDCLTRYFRYQLKTLPEAPLYEPNNPKGGSWWAAQRGGDNLMLVLWLYNITGDKFLLELGDLIDKQTVPVTDWFSPSNENMIRRRADQGATLHCVNLAQMMKTPIVRWQQDRDTRHLDAVENAFNDIRTFHGQVHGLFGGDEHLHGDAPDRGSELCSAVEMMFSLETMFEISGNPVFGDRLERIAFNALPTQTTDDFRARQYFQQVNQVEISAGSRDFFVDGGERQVFGLLNGYPCCTCNLHQGWPKFVQHLWLASKDGGVALMAYAPSSATVQVAGGRRVILRQAGGYPFKESVTITIETGDPVTFPLHFRIPGWAEGASIEVNGELVAQPGAGTMYRLSRGWKNGDIVRMRFPMPIRTSQWFARSRAIERGPLVFALDIQEDRKEVERARPEGVPASAMHRGYFEVHPGSPWNYALPPQVVSKPEQHISVEVKDVIMANPWSRETAPVKLSTRGVRLPYWTMNRNSAALPPVSPVEGAGDLKEESITLIPYGATTLRIAEFPWLASPKR